MAVEISQRRRNSLAGEIIRRGTEKTAASRELPGDQPAISDRTIADDGVIAVRSGIDPPVINIEGQFDLGMLGEKGIERRAEMHAAEGDGGGDADRA